MKPILLAVPFLGLSVFGGYYRHWNAEFTSRLDSIAHDPLAIYRFRDGQADAKADLAHGKRRLLLNGSTPSYQPELSGLLDRIYQVQVKFVTPHPTPELQRYAAAYNTVMEQDLAATYGTDSLNQARALAEDRHALNERNAAYVSLL